MYDMDKAIRGVRLNRRRSGFMAVSRRGSRRRTPCEPQWRPGPSNCWDQSRPDQIKPEQRPAVLLPLQMGLLTRAREILQSQTNMPCNTKPTKKIWSLRIGAHPNISHDELSNGVNEMYTFSDCPKIMHLLRSTSRSWSSVHQKDLHFTLKFVADPSLGRFFFFEPFVPLKGGVPPPFF